MLKAISIAGEGLSSQQEFFYGSAIPNGYNLRMREPLLTPSEIAGNLHDSGQVPCKGDAQRLERRIIAYGSAQAAEAHNAALKQAARRAQSALCGIRGAAQRAAAARIVRAVEALLPHDGKEREAYALGFRDGSEAERRKLSNTVSK